MSITTQITRLNNNIEAMKNTKQQIKDAVNNDFDIIANEQIENYDTLIENGLELYKQYIPPVETNQATDIQVTDAMKCNSNKLELFGNTEQDNTKMTYKCDGTETGDYYLTYDSTDYYFTMPTITEGDILVFDTADLKLYLADTEITTESTGTGTNLTFIASPNSDYPQDIHVVSGENTIGVNSKNFYDATQGQQTKNSLTYSADNQYIYLDGKVSSGFNCDFKHFLIPKGTYTMMFELKDGSINTTNDGGLFYVYGSVSTSAQRITNTNKRRAVTFTLNTDGFVYVHVWPRSSETFSNARIAYQLVKENVADYNFVPYYHADYPINLGSLELCKIGDYQDYLYKENGNWYKYKNIHHSTFRGLSDWTYQSNNKRFIVTLSNTPKNQGKAFSNFYTNGETIGNNNYFSVASGSGYSQLLIHDERFTTKEDFNAWIENNNIEVYYILNTPTTTQITDETLISQLDEIYEHLQLVKGTNNITVTAADLKPYMKLSYKNYELTSNE